MTARRPLDADLLVVGGGPAGCAAAVMAASLNLACIIIEPGARLGGSLWRIATINNVLGDHHTGPDLAAAVQADVERTEPTVIRAEATNIEAGDHYVIATLADGRHVTGKHVVVATGVRPTQPHESTWVTTSTSLTLPPLWDADITDAEGQTWLVLGADRPLGTFLRAHPGLEITLLVPHPPSDSYKTEEIARDPRVSLIPVDALTLDEDLIARPHGLGGDQVFINIGVAPSTIRGLVRDADGYYPTQLQHPRVHVAGDLRSPRGQRVQTAMGTGAASALDAYYALRA